MDLCVGMNLGIPGTAGHEGSCDSKKTMLHSHEHQPECLQE